MGNAPRSRSRWNDALRILAVALATLIAAPSIQGAEGARDVATVPAETEELLVGIEVNGESTGTATIVVGPERKAFLPEADYRRLRLTPPPEGAIVSVDGERMVAMDAIAPIRYSLDARTLTLRITAPPEAFEASTFDASRTATPRLSPSPPGAFLN
jgi:outer membrane usher protein FimD/PapC